MPSSNWRLGLLLAAATMSLWSTLPIAAKLALQGLDPYTLTWARFTFAFLFTAIWVLSRGQVKELRGLTGSTYAWLGAAGVALVGNYLLYLLGLNYTTPSNAQVLIQSAPLLLGLGGLVFFGERFNSRQWKGLGILFAGMGLFFQDQLRLMFGASSGYLTGSGIILASAAAWAAYALIQKRLYGTLGSQQILLFIYALGSLILLPLSDISSVLQLSGGTAVAVLYCCLNTVLAYGFFAKAVEVWSSSQVSAVLTLTPLGTMALMFLMQRAGLQWLEPEFVSGFGWLGALGVVTGSLTISLAGRQPATSPAEPEPV